MIRFKLIQVILFLLIISLCINIYNLYSYRDNQENYMDFKDCPQCPNSNILCWGKLIDVGENIQYFYGSPPYPSLPTYSNYNNDNKSDIVKFRYDNQKNIFYVTYRNDQNKEYSVKKLQNTMCMVTGILYDENNNRVYGWHEYNNLFYISKIDQNIIPNIPNFMIDPKDFHSDDYEPSIDTDININFIDISYLSKS